MTSPQDTRERRAPSAGRQSPLPRALRRAGPILAPAVLLAALIGVWQAYVDSGGGIGRYILPSPTDVVAALVRDWAMLSDAWMVTLGLTLGALAAAVIGGVGLAVLFTRWRLVENAFSPIAVMLQVTPVVAIAPLLVIYIHSTTVIILVVAFMVGFFPMLAATMQGLRSADRNLADLFTLYRAGPATRLLRLQLPSALPYFAAGLRTAGGLALIGAVVAEFAVGAPGTRSGLAYRIVEAGLRLETARLFAALLLIILSGIAIYVATGLVTRLLLRRWHESAAPAEA